MGVQSVVHLFGVGVDQLALEQEQRGFVVQHDVMEGIGQDFGHPNQTGLYIFDEEQMDGSEQ